MASSRKESRWAVPPARVPMSESNAGGGYRSRNDPPASRGRERGDPGRSSRLARHRSNLSRSRPRVVVSEANAFARECFRDIASVDRVLRRIPVNTASVRDRSSPQAEATIRGRHRRRLKEGVESTPPRVSILRFLSPRWRWTSQIQRSQRAVAREDRQKFQTDPNTLI